MRSIRCAAVLAALCASGAWGFGQNKVNVHNFRWRIVSTAHFDIHYTPESAPIVPRAAVLLEQAYRRVAGGFQVEMKERVPFFLLANHNEFEENNVVPVGEGTGGVTEAFKNRIVIFNDGTRFWLEHVATHEFAHAVQFEVLYGGFWRSARLLKSPLYPLWFMEGMAEYVTGDIDLAEEDMYLRDAATTGRLYALADLHGFNHVKPHQVTLAYKQGGAAVRYLAEEYGTEKVPALLRGLRERFETAALIGDLTGRGFPRFDQSYREDLIDRYEAQVKALGLREPDAYGERLTAQDTLPAFNTNPAFSPDSRRMAYLTDRAGPRRLVLRDLATGGEREAAGRDMDRVENIHPEGRALSFSPDGRWIAFTGEKEQRDFLYLYDVERDRLRRVRLPFEQLRSPVFHPQGDRLTVVGMSGGSNDLYEITPRGRVLRRLTRSDADESDPIYSPDGATLVYSEEIPPERGHGRDLAALDLTALSTAPLTAMPGFEISPAFTPDGKSLLFAADGPERVRNIYRLDLAEGRAVRLTSVVGGAFTPVVAPDGKGVLFVSFRRTSMDIYAAGPGFWRDGPGSAALPDPQPARSAWARGGPPPAPAGGPAAAQPSAESVPLLADRPYRFAASTDLFFPLFYYSSADGLFLATLWQASDNLGNHQLRSTLQYSSGDDFLDYQVQYAYGRFRPQFILGASGENVYRDFSRSELRRESSQFAGVSYPLNRVNRVELAFSTLRREDLFDGLPQLDFRERDNAGTVSFLRDTTSGRYLSVTQGHRFRATYRAARRVFSGTRQYNTHSFEYHRFTPTGGESALAFRGLSAVSAGRSPEELRLGGRDRLRGYPRNGPDNQAARYVLGNLEWRVPLKYLDFQGFFLFPDFQVKAVYGAVFTDAGYDWSRSADLRALRADRVRHSVGGGLRLPTFVLQTFPVTLTVDVAKRTDRNQWVWYFSFGPEF